MDLGAFNGQAWEGEPRLRRAGRSGLVVAVVAAMIAVTLARAHAATPDGLVPRPVPTKPEQSDVQPGYSDERLHLKLVEGVEVRVIDGMFVGEGAEELNRVLADAGATAERLFTRPFDVLADEKARIEAESGREVADKNLYFRVLLPADSDAAGVLDALNALAVVEIAYAEPLPQPLPVTPDFQPQQVYLAAGPGGIDANKAHAVAGGRGQNVQVVDVEYAWNDAHEDLGAALGGLIPFGVPCIPPFPSVVDHGTAVLGQLAGADNGFGVTGIVPEAAIGMVNAATGVGACNFAVGIAIDTAHANLEDGDIILIEQQVPGPPVCGASMQPNMVPVELVWAVWDAIYWATSDGIIVVEAAGNGNCDLDHPAYGSTPLSSDSLAIVVGAGAAPGAALPARSRLDFSTHGNRVDLQGTGEMVVTAGYGDLQGGNSNAHYTSVFAGTSSASPIVAGAAAIQSSIAQQLGFLLKPADVRALLMATGTPQDTTAPGALAGQIGPQPDLGAAIDSLFADNDDVADSLALASDAGSAAATNVAATGETGEISPSCATDPQLNSVWWTWTPTETGTAVVDTVGSSFDTILSVHTGATVGSLTELVCSDGLASGSFASMVEFDVIAGMTYRIRVDGFGSDTGTVVLRFRVDPDPDPVGVVDQDQGMWHLQYPVTARMTGANVVPSGSGDQSGFGRAVVAANQNSGRVCFALELAGVQGPVTATNIRQGAAGANGPVVVDLAWPTNGTEGCVNSTPAQVDALLANPAGYYVDVHGGSFPAGAVRGQLSVDASPPPFFFGDPADTPFLGDWDGDGVATPGLHRTADGKVYLRNSNTPGAAEVEFFFGNPGDVPLAGDWDGDGDDTVSIYRPSEQRFYIINELGSANQGLGPADFSFPFGDPEDRPLAGDWNGDGTDSVAVHRISTGLVYGRNTLDEGIAHFDYIYGDPNDSMFGGDWDGDGRDTPSLFRPSDGVAYLRNSLTKGSADMEVFTDGFESGDTAAWTSSK